MTEPLLYRSLADADVEVRSEGDGRTITGILVPWNKPVRIDSTLVEEFLPGAFDRQVRSPGRIQLAGGAHFRDGGALIGRVTMLRNDARGLYGEARVSATRDGDDILELIRDEVAPHLSIGFREGQNLRGQNGVVQRKTATMTELAAGIRSGAYGEHAKVLALRSGGCAACGAAAVVEESTRSNIEQAARVLASLRPLPASPR